MHKRRKIQIGLVIAVLVILSVGVVFRSRFLAAITGSYSFSGTVFSEETKQAVGGASISVSSSTDPSLNIINATADDKGNYTITFAKSGYDQLSVTKDGFYDIESYFYIPGKVTATSFSVPITLKPGFGVEAASIYVIPEGFNNFSTPFTPYGNNANETLSYVVPTGYGDGRPSTYAMGTLLKDFDNGGVTIKHRLSLSYLDEKGNIQIYDPNNVNSIKIEVGRSYYLTLPTTSSKNSFYTFMLKGKPVLSDLDVPLIFNPQNISNPTSASSPDTPISNPFTTIITTDDLRIMQGNDGIEYSIADAIAKNYISKDWKIKTGPNPTDVKTFDLSQGSVGLRPGLGSLLHANNTLFKVRFKYQNINNWVEVPSDISLENAEWAFWVDRQTLGMQDQVVWDTVVGKLSATSLNNDSSFQTFSEEKPGAFHDIRVSYTKNGKIIPAIQPDNVPLPPVPSFSRFVTLGVSLPPYCTMINKFQLCFGKINNSLGWEKIDIDNLKYEFTHSYEFIEKYFGPPLLTGYEEQKGYKTILIYMSSDLSSPTYGAEYDFQDNIIKLNPVTFRASSYNDQSFMFIHELIHAWRDDYAPDGPKTKSSKTGEKASYSFTMSWEEGQTSLIETMVANDREMATSTLESFIQVETSFYERNSMYLNTSNTKAWRNRAVRTYELAAASWMQLYGQDPQVFVKFNARLKNLNNPFVDMESVLQNKSVGNESFFHWYERMWAGLTHVYINNYIGKRLYQGSYFENGKTGEFIEVINVISSSGANVEIPDGYKWTLFKSYMDSSSGKKITTQVNHGSQGPKDMQLKFDNNTLNTKRKYTIVNLVTTDPGTPKVKPYGKTINYFAIPETNACIYGIVAEAYNTGVTVTPVLPAGTPEVFSVTNGYFSVTTDNPAYGCDAGTYNITYQPKSGKTPRSYNITKEQTKDGFGKIFLPIKTGVNTLQPNAYNGNGLKGKIASIFGFNKNSAQADCDECYSEELKIENIKSETQDDGSTKISFTTTRPAATYIDWGEMIDYNQLTDMEDEAGLNHEFFLSPTLAGKTYHYKITAIDTTGAIDPAIAGGISDEESDFISAYSIDSGDNTFTPCPKITIPQVTNNSATSVMVSWDINPGVSTTIEYGISTSYGSSQPINSTDTHQSVILTGLTAGQTYHFRVKVSDITNCNCSATNVCTDNTFTMPNVVVPALDLGFSQTEGYLSTGQHSTPYGLPTDPDHAPNSLKIKVTVKPDTSVSHVEVEWRTIDSKVDETGQHYIVADSGSGGIDLTSNKGFKYFSSVVSAVYPSPMIRDENGYYYSRFEQWRVKSFTLAGTGQVIDNLVMWIPTYGTPYFSYTSPENTLSGGGVNRHFWENTYFPYWGSSYRIYTGTYYATRANPLTTVKTGGTYYLTNAELAGKTLREAYLTLKDTSWPSGSDYASCIRDSLYGIIYQYIVVYGEYPSTSQQAVGSSDPCPLQ